MTASSTFRELSLSPGADLDNKVPAGLNVTGPRKGGPINLRYRIEFLDDDDNIVLGGTEASPDPGSMALQWWAIVFQDPELKTAAASYPWPLLPQPAVKTVELGGTIGATGGQVNDIAVRGPFWVWPQVAAVTAPVVYGKAIQVTIPAVTPDGTYSIQRDDEDPVEYEATGATWDEIGAALSAGFAGDTVVTADWNNGFTILFTCEAGGDFELTLVSPGSILTQATLALAGSGNAATKARMIAHVTGPLVELGD